jgi:hypothetical protein
MKGRIYLRYQQKMKMEQGRQSEVENFNPREVHASRFLLENAWTLYWIIAHCLLGNAFLDYLKTP